MSLRDRLRARAERRHLQEVLAAQDAAVAENAAAIAERQDAAIGAWIAEQRTTASTGVVPTEQQLADLGPGENAEPAADHVPPTPVNPSARGTRRRPMPGDENPVPNQYRAVRVGKHAAAPATVHAHRVLAALAYEEHAWHHAEARLVAHAWGIRAALEVA